MDNLLDRGITYRDLDRVLLALGFHETTHPTHLLYEKEDAGAVIMLPRHTLMDDAAHAVHLLTARHTLTGAGIVREGDFENMLGDPGVSQPRLLTKVHGHPPVRGRDAKPRVRTAAPTAKSG